MNIEIIDNIIITDKLTYVIAVCDDKKYEMYVEADDTLQEYNFYYLNGLKPSYTDFEYEIICNL